MMHRITMLLLSWGALSLAACTSPTYNYQPEAKDISAPPIGVVSTAMVGDKLLEQGRYETIDAIRLSKPVSVGLLGAYTFTTGVYRKYGQSADGEFYNSGNFPESGQVHTSALADPFQVMLLERNGTTLCGVTVFNVKACESGVVVQRIKIPSATADTFQQTLIYNGKVGNKINIGYREFSGNFARPAFSNEVEYDLGESKTFGYKSAVIEVIEATNQYIKYIVRQNFNGAAH